MDAKIGKFFDSVGSFFTGGDNIPWCDRDVIAFLEFAFVSAPIARSSTWKCSRLSLCPPGGASGLVQNAPGGWDWSVCWQLGSHLRLRGAKFEEREIEVEGCEREVAESGNEENKNESLMRLSWALVHSRQPEDVNRGIGMLEASLNRSNSPLQTREKLYLLAVGHYRNGDYSRSRQLLERCLEIAPDMRQALNLKKVVEDKIAKDGVIGIGIAATAVGLVVGGIAAAVARKK